MPSSFKSKGTLALPKKLPAKEERKGDREKSKEARNASLEQISVGLGDHNASVRAVPRSKQKMKEPRPVVIDVGIPSAAFLDNQNCHTAVPLDEVSRKYQSIYIHYHGFSSMTSTRGHVVKSPPFNCFNHEWCVYMYPGGSFEATEDGRTSFYLRQLSENTTTVCFDVVVKSKQRERKKESKPIGEESPLKGWNHFFKRSCLLKCLRNETLMIEIRINSGKSKACATALSRRNMLKYFLEKDGVDTLIDLLSEDTLARLVRKVCEPTLSRLCEDYEKSDFDPRVMDKRLNQFYKTHFKRAGGQRACTFQQPCALRNSPSKVGLLDACESIAEKPTTICIVGGGPVGLITACMLLENKSSLEKANIQTPPLKIVINDCRWKKEKVVWKGKSQGIGDNLEKENRENNRRRQVVTIQSKVWHEFPKIVQNSLFLEKGNDFAEFWPLGPDSPNENGFPRNIPIMYIEDKLLALLQNEDLLDEFGVIEHKPELRASKATKDELESILTNVDYLILADGGRSQTEMLLKEMGVVDTNSFGKHQIVDEDLTDTVLGIFLDFQGIDLTGMLTEKECMAVTISNNRLLLNHLPGRFGFLNLWLAPEEIDEAVGVVEGVDGTQMSVTCTQAQPCRFVLNNQGQFRCPTHKAVFRPPLDENSALWKTISESLKLFGIPLDCVKEFVKFQLGPYSKRAEFHTDGEFDGNKFKVFLLGDAATSVNFRFGRGLNTGLKGAISLTRTLARAMASDQPRDADFVDHHGYMSKLAEREVKIRSVKVMQNTSHNILCHCPGQGRLSDDSRCVQEYKARVGNIIDGPSFARSRLSPDLQEPNGAYLDHIDSLDPGFVRNLLLSGPWDTSTAGGKEVEVVKAWWISDGAAGETEDEGSAEATNTGSPSAEQRIKTRSAEATK